MRSVAGGYSHVQIDDDPSTVQIRLAICAQRFLISFLVRVGGHLLDNVGVLFAKVVLLLVVSAIVILMPAPIEDPFSAASETDPSLLDDE